MTYYDTQCKIGTYYVTEAKIFFYVQFDRQLILWNEVPFGRWKNLLALTRKENSNRNNHNNVNQTPSQTKNNRT